MREGEGLEACLQQQQPNFIQLDGVGYMDQITSQCSIIKHILIQLIDF